MRNIWIIVVGALFAGGLFSGCDSDVEESIAELEPEIHLNPADSVAMISVYDGLKLKESGQIWNLEDPGSWPGIQYDTIGNVAYVNSIRINSSPAINPVTADRQAFLSPEIGKLERLRHLSVREIFLWSTFIWDLDKMNCLPDELFDLPLEELTLVNVKGIKALDSRIAKLSDTLKSLYVNGCNVEVLPEELSQLSNLESLDLKGNQIKGKVPDFMFRFKCSVYLNDNKFTELDWDSLYEAGQKDYTIPLLCKNELQGAIPERFENDSWQTILMKYLYPQTILGLTYSNGEDWPRMN